MGNKYTEFLEIITPNEGELSVTNKNLAALHFEQRHYKLVDVLQMYNDLKEPNAYLTELLLKHLNEMDEKINNSKAEGHTFFANIVRPQVAKGLVALLESSKAKNDEAIQELANTFLRKEFCRHVEGEKGLDKITLEQARKYLDEAWFEEQFINTIRQGNFRQAKSILEIWPDDIDLDNPAKSENREALFAKALDEAFRKQPQSDDFIKYFAQNRIAGTYDYFKKKINDYFNKENPPVPSPIKLENFIHSEPLALIALTRAATNGTEADFEALSETVKAKTPFNRSPLDSQKEPIASANSEEFVKMQLSEVAEHHYPVMLASRLKAQTITQEDVDKALSSAVKSLGPHKDKEKIIKTIRTLLQHTPSPSQVAIANSFMASHCSSPKSESEIDTETAQLLAEKLDVKNSDVMRVLTGTSSPKISDVELQKRLLQTIEKDPQSPFVQHKTNLIFSIISIAMQESIKASETQSWKIPGGGKETKINRLKDLMKQFNHEKGQSGPDIRKLVEIVNAFSTEAHRKRHGFFNRDTKPNSAKEFDRIAGLSMDSLKKMSQPPNERDETSFHP